MATYNIPGITTSLIDNSYLATNVASGRSVLIAGFSKYGTEDLFMFNDVKQVTAKLGLENIKKFGLGIKYVKGALTRTNKVLWKRLVANDATYANVILTEDYKFGAITTTDKKILTDNNLKINGLDNIIKILAKDRGLGYNDLSIVFAPAVNFEKLYANDEGDLDYKFNFLNASIYENTSKGPVLRASDILVSLIDRDPETGVPILNMNTGKELFVDKKFTMNNEFIEISTNEYKLPDLYKYMGLSNLIEEQGRKVILKDQTTGVNFEFYVNKDEGLSIKATQLEGLEEEILQLIQTDANGTVVTKKYSITVNDSQINTTAYYGNTEGTLSLNINGEKAFYKLFIDENETLATEVINFMRYDVYNALINNPIKLVNGSDGENVIIDNVLNMQGPGSIEAPNAKQLLLQFFDGDPLIREVMYPRYDFDYIPDWTNDFDVMTSIVNLADEIGFTIPITSLGYSNSVEEDATKRSQDYYVNSFNTLIYSGQCNDEHFDEGSGSYITIPHSYMAMLINLKIDSEYSITEPPANINKGALLESSVKLSYTITSAGIETLRNMQVNTIIEETDGTYEIDQLSAYKKASKLSRINIIKPIHRMRKDIPKLLKDFIQVKALGSNISEITNIVSRYMDRYRISADNLKDGIFQDIKIKVYFIEEENHLVVSITINPVGTIETISVPIQVQ